MFFLLTLVATLLLRTTFYISRKHPLLKINLIYRTSGQEIGPQVLGILVKVRKISAHYTTQGWVEPAGKLGEI
jgi:hypothetical protein